MFFSWDRRDIKELKLNVQEVQNLNNNSLTPLNKVDKLRVGLVSYLNKRFMPNDSFETGFFKPKNPIESLYEKFLLKYNQNALLDRYMSESSINKMLEKAPVVAQILEEKGEKAIPCVDNLKNIENTHVKTTVDAAMGIAEQMNLSAEDKHIVAMGALFHDFGKIMMPQHMLNKKGRLTPEERSVVDTHSRIGYEMLKTTGMDERILSLVRNHHRASSMTNDFRARIVSVADVYSALTEKRSYKASLSPEDAFAIMQSFVMEGKLDGEIVSALQAHVNSQEKKAA